MKPAQTTTRSGSCAATASAKRGVPGGAVGVVARRARRRSGMSARGGALEAEDRRGRSAPTATISAGNRGSRRGVEEGLEVRARPGHEHDEARASGGAFAGTRGHVAGVLGVRAGGMPDPRGVARGPRSSAATSRETSDQERAGRRRRPARPPRGRRAGRAGPSCASRADAERAAGEQARHDRRGADARDRAELRRRRPRRRGERAAAAQDHGADQPGHHREQEQQRRGCAERRPGSRRAAGHRAAGRPTPRTGSIDRAAPAAKPGPAT